MKTSFWRRWFNSLRGASPNICVSCARPRRYPLCLEALEDRVTPTLIPQMVLDINTTTPSMQDGGITEILAIGSTTYVRADDGVHGDELWKSDGTAAGTVLVKDIYPGSDASFPHELTNFNGTLYFTANDGVHSGLWKSDGTAAGTVLVSSSGSGPAYLTDVNGTLFFRASDGTINWELWKSDGTAAGTVLVKDINPGSASSVSRNFTNVNGTLFFTASDGTTGEELWKSDGTAAGTVLVKDILPGGAGSSPYSLTNVNGTLFFSAWDGTNGRELWKSNGTAAGTVLVKDIKSGSASSYPRNLTNVNGTLFFRADDGTTNRELWKSDGTAAGTVLVKDINPGIGWSYPDHLVDVNGTLFFTAYDGIHGWELWKSDGTEAGTVLVKDTSTNQLNFSPDHLTDVNGTLFFIVTDNANFNGMPLLSASAELWKSDGTSAGTVLVKDIYAGRAYSSPYSLTNANGILFFTASDVLHGRELWKSDGTAAGTALVKDINNANTLSSYPHNSIEVNGTLFFAANDGINGVELWKSDGTVSGTTLVKDICPGSHWSGSSYSGYSYSVNSSYPRNLTDVNGTLFFTLSDGGVGLWKSDGTAAGTVQLSSVWSTNLTNVNGTLFFSAYDGMNGTELWKSDGTVAGTTLVKDIYPGTHREYDYYGNWWYVPNSSSPGKLTNVNGTLFFTATDGSNGTELWKSDGTTAGTTLVKDIRPGSASSYSYIGTLIDVNGTLFFSANDGTTGFELWKSDGTVAGTTLVKDIRPGSAGSYLHSLANLNGTLLFSANDGTTGHELWKSDGTAAGTVLVKDIRPGSAHSYPYPGRARLYPEFSGVTTDNGTLFFTANDGVHGRELWKSDGTADGTVLIKDLLPGIGNFFDGPSFLTDVNGTLFFSANYWGDGLWQSDGTTAGTMLISNLSPASLGNFNGTLFFTTNDGVHGSELWKLVDDGLPALTIGDATVTEGHAGTRLATFTVTLSTASDQPVTVAYATADGTAAAGSDYQAASGTLTIPAGQTTGTITVLVNGDHLGEPNETFLVNLSNPTNGTVVDSQGIGTILDDEPRISISDATVIEGNTGTRAATFTVTLSAASDQSVSVAYATSNGSAAAVSDYQAASGTLTIPAGQTTGTIAVLVNGDRAGEANETFLVNLSGATNAVVVDAQGVGTIVDDEPRISISDVAKAEGKNRETTLFTFTVTLSAAYDQAVTMSFATANGTARTSNNDYIAKTGTLTFAPGETTKTITIEVKGDSRKEADETFYLDLFGNSSNSLFTKSRGIGTILNDD